VATAVKIDNLSVAYDDHFQALTDVSLQLPVGKTIGFIGPSGAGKTSLIRCIVGRLKPSQGSITIFDHSAGNAGLRHEVSYMTQNLAVYPDLTVRENLTYFVIMAGQPKKQSAAMVNQILQTIDLEDKADNLVSNLSGGQKQRVSLGVALIGSPKLMVLDEPTVGLDPVLRDRLWRLFNELAEAGTTLIISSHSMDEAERCDDLVLMRDGQVIAHESPKKLCEQTNTKRVEQAFLSLVGTDE
jgi:ABC-2 type transport system ATP-binding protein